MIGVSRATATLIGAGLAGFLLWAASLFELGASGEFWAAMGFVAGAGVVIGLSQLPGRSGTASGSGLLAAPVLIGFVPIALVTAWILLATQPEGGWQQGRIEGWSWSIGIGGIVADLGIFASVLCFGTGVVFALSSAPLHRIRAGFDRTVPREEPVIEEDVHDFEPKRERERVGKISQREADERERVIPGL